MEAANSSEMFITIHQTLQCHISESSVLFLFAIAALLCEYFKWSYNIFSGRDSVVDVAAHCGLGDGIPFRARFSLPIQTSHQVHPDSCTVGTGSFPGIKRPDRGADHPPPSSTEVTNGLELNLRLPSVPT